MDTTRRGLIASLGGSLLALGILGAGKAAHAQPDCQALSSPEAGRADIAVSLRRLEADLGRCQAAGTCAPQALTWFGMTRVSGYAVDRANHDIVLFGTTDPSPPCPLRVSDFVVALRNAKQRYAERRGDVLVYTDPAVTIDPNPAVLRRLEQTMAGNVGGTPARDRRLQAWCNTCKLPQSVRVMGLGADTDSHFGYTMFAADLLMKSISNSTASVDGLDSLADLSMRMAIEQAKQHPSRAAGRAQLNRFWFFPGMTSYLEDSNTAVLARADVILRTEAEQIATYGRIGGSGRTDPLAEQFACDFTRIYPQLAAAGTRYPVYAELEALFRWVALARILAGGGAFEAAGYHPDFLLDDFAVPRVQVPRTTKGIAHVATWDHVETDGSTRTQTSLRLPSCGGVAIALEREDMTALADTGRKLPRVNAAVISARSAQPIAWWIVGS